MKTEIRNELREIAASLTNIGNANCYRVPDNYFEGFADEVLSKIHLPITQLPYAAPAPTYFEELADSVLNKIKGNGTIIEADNEVTKELTAISPFIASIKRVNVYTVPANYFATFKVAVPVREIKAQLVPMHRSPARWMRYTAAAAIVGIVALGGVFLLRNNDISNHGSSTVVNYKKPLSTISDDVIANYLNQSPAQLDVVPTTYDDSQINAGNLAEQLLNDIPDSAIQDYLQENKQPGDEDIKGI